MGRRVLLQKHYIGLCIQYIVSVCAGVICVCAQRTEHPKMWDICVPPIRGCAHVKVYLKLFNEALSNCSWRCRQTSLTLFHWRQWGRRERGVVPSDLATVEKRQVQCIWAKVPHVFDLWDPAWSLDFSQRVEGRISLFICWTWWTVLEFVCVGD